MSFTTTQIRKLRTRPKPEWIRQRQKNGAVLHYLEGAYAIAEANRILGHDAWDRETLSNGCVWSKHIGSIYCAAYVARVRITVHTADRTIVREACGAAEAQEPTPGAAHERAVKSAETDATKRALCTLGNAFGLGLYVRPPSNLSDQQTLAAEDRKVVITANFNHHEAHFGHECFAHYTTEDCHQK